MARVRRGGGGIVVALDAAEAELLRRMLDELCGELRARLPGRPGDGDAREDVGDSVGAAFDTQGPTAPPEDPALARLLPDAYPDDPAAAAEMRRLTEPDLVQAKLDAATAVGSALLPTGGKLILDQQSGAAWLAALNDLRLLLGTRLGVTEDGDPFGGHRPNESAAAPYVVYHWLTGLQDRLVGTISAG